MDEQEYEFEVWQDDMCVASASARDQGAALRVAIGYASQYQQDGPVEIHQITRTILTPESVGSMLRGGSPAGQDADGNPVKWIDFASHQEAVASSVSSSVMAFAHAILHGDDEHRGWLLAAAHAFINEYPIPPARGLGRAEAAESRLKEVEAELKRINEVWGAPTQELLDHRDKACRADAAEAQVASLTARLERLETVLTDARRFVVARYSDAAPWASSLLKGIDAALQQEPQSDAQA